MFCALMPHAAAMSGEIASPGLTGTSALMSGAGLSGCCATGGSGVGATGVVFGLSFEQPITSASARTRVVVLMRPMLPHSDVPSRKLTLAHALDRRGYKH